MYPCRLQKARTKDPVLKTYQSDESLRGMWKNPRRPAPFALKKLDEDEIPHFNHCTVGSGDYHYCDRSIRRSRTRCYRSCKARCTAKICVREAQRRPNCFTFAENLLLFDRGSQHLI